MLSAENYVENVKNSLHFPLFQWNFNVENLILYEKFSDFINLHIVFNIFKSYRIEINFCTICSFLLSLLTKKCYTLSS